MKILKKIVFAAVAFGLLANCASAQNKRNGNVKKKMEEQTVKPGKRQETKPPQFESGDKIKNLAAGSHSTVETPFVFVARTPETFEQLRKMVENLPSEKIDFGKTAVVAAFAGEKNTGGYSVTIGKKADKISVNVVAPPKDAFVTQVLTAPYAVALVEIEPGNGLNLDLPTDFSAALKKYRVTGGEFGVSGGIAGINRKFSAAGSIGILSYGKYVTLVFDLTEKAGGSRRRLNEIASGILDGEKINLARLEAGNFIDGPHPPLVVGGILSKEKLSLTFESSKSDYMVSDGFTGNGKIEAAEIK